MVKFIAANFSVGVVIIVVVKGKNMKKLLFVLLGACLTACGAAPDFSESGGDNENEWSLGDHGSYGPWGHGGVGPAGCSQAVSYLHIVVDGNEYWVAVPTFCAEAISIYKGDPGPDMGDPYEGDGPVTVEEILEKFNDRLLESSRAGSTSLQ